MNRHGKEIARWHCIRPDDLILIDLKVVPLERSGLSQISPLKQYNYFDSESYMFLSSMLRA